MRYDTPVYFQFVERGKYNADSGNYDEETVVEDKQWADITDSGVETIKLVYGELKQGIKTIRLQRPYLKAYSRIRIGEKLYNADFARPLRSKAVFVVSEIQ